VNSTDDRASFDNNSSGTGTPEALVLSFDTSGLAQSTTLTLQSFKTALWTADDRIDVVVYDASEGTVTKWLKNAGNAFLNAANVVVETGDLVIIGVSTDGVNGKWRIDDIKFEVDSLISPYGAHHPVPEGPLKIVSSSPADVTLSWYSPLQDGTGAVVGEPNVVSVDNYEIRVSKTEPNLALVTPIDKDLAQSHVLSVSDGDTVYWRVDTTVTFDSNDIMGDPLTQVIEGFPWSFTVTEDGPVSSVVWDNEPNMIGSWPGAVAEMSVTVTDSGSSDVTLTFSSNFDPNVVFMDEFGVPLVSNQMTVPGGGSGGSSVSYPVKVSCDTAINPATLTVEAVDAINTGDVQTDSTQMRVFISQCQASRLGIIIDGQNQATIYDADIVLDIEEEGIYSACVIDLADFAEIARQWLVNYIVDAPFEY
jgi:hypothetical protein